MVVSSLHTEQYPTGMKTIEMRSSDPNLMLIVMSLQQLLEQRKRAYEARALSFPIKKVIFCFYCYYFNAKSSQNSRLIKMRYLLTVSPVVMLITTQLHLSQQHVQLRHSA